MSIESMMPSNHLILCCSLFLLLSIFPSIKVFSSESALCIRWLKYWSFSFSISLSNEHSGLISFRIDWFKLTVQGTLQGPCPGVFSITTVQSINSSALSLLYDQILTFVHDYRKDPIALTTWTFVGPCSLYAL